MMCFLCKESEFTYNDVLGEEVCDACGYVMVNNIFEEKVSLHHNQYDDMGKFQENSGDKTIMGVGAFINPNDTKGLSTVNKSLFKRLARTQKRLMSSAEQSLLSGYMECNMVLSPYLPNANLKDRSHHYYRKLWKNHDIRGWTIAVRAVSIVYVVLKENEIAVTLKELSDVNNVPSDKVSKCSKKIARVLGKPWLLANMNLGPWLEKACYNLKLNSNDTLTRDVRKVCEYIHKFVSESNLAFTKTYLAASFWITILLVKNNNLSQKAISEACGCTPQATRITLTSLLPALKVTKEDLKGMTIEEFIGGIRYG